jgi:hypothetical protein
VVLASSLNVSPWWFKFSLRMVQCMAKLHLVVFSISYFIVCVWFFFYWDCFVFFVVRSGMLFVVCVGWGSWLGFFFFLLCGI